MFTGHISYGITARTNKHEAHQTQHNRKKKLLQKESNKEEQKKNSLINLKTFIFYALERFCLSSGAHEWECKK